MTTTTLTLVGDPDPDENQPACTEPEAADLPARPGILEADDLDHDFYTVVDGQVVASGHDLPAVDAVALVEEESRAPVVARPVVGEWVSEPDTLREVVAEWFGRVWQVTKFHTVRSPIYLAKLVGTSPLGIKRAGVAAYRWRRDEDFYLAVDTIRVSGGKGDIEQLTAAHKATVKTRTRILLALAVAIPAVCLLLRPGLLAAVVGAAAVGLGLYGRPERKTPIVERSTYRAASFPPFTEDLMVRALRTVIGGKKADRDITVIQPPAKTKTGWEAIVTVPGAAADVVKKREDFAAEIGRPNSCVWMATGDTAGDGEDRSAAWLKISVTRKSLRRMAMAPWPLLDAGPTDYFHDLVPVGVDAMGEPVTVRKAYQCSVFGGIMGSGKSVSMMTQVLGEMNDDRVEGHFYDYKGGVDWEPCAKIAHVYVSGSDVADHEMILADLQDLNGRMDRRAVMLREVNAQGIKTPKITSELADRTDFDFCPIKIVIDETQEPFEFAPKKMAEEYRRLLFRLVKKGRAYGITVDAGTQEIKQPTLPWASLAVWRHCHMVSHHTQVELVLGTGSYSAGNHADKLTSADVGIGFFGSGKDIRLVRGYFIDPDDGTLDAVCERLAERRRSRGLLTGMAVGTIEPNTDLEGTLDRVARVWAGSSDRLHLVELLAMLHDDQPTEYPVVTVATLRTGDVARAVGVLSGQLSRNGIEADNMRRPFLSDDDKSVVRKGIRWTDITNALQTRNHQPDHDTSVDEGDTGGGWDDINIPTINNPDRHDTDRRGQADPNDQRSA